MPKKVNITGQRFGRLVAISPTDKRDKGNVIWKCQCDCGNLCEVSSIMLRRGKAYSCGCLTVKNKKLGTNICSIKSNKPYKSNLSGTRGVSWDSQRGKWTAKIAFRGKTKTLGYFESLEDAITARTDAEQLRLEELEFLRKQEL